jgi:murein DD-endopeptidase MepM/ murein hydrolase activator NlpD
VHNASLTRVRPRLAVAGLVGLAVAAVVGAQSIGAVDVGRASSLGDTVDASSAISGGLSGGLSGPLSARVAPRTAPARTAPDVSVGAAVTSASASSVATSPVGSTTTRTAGITGVRDRRERAVSRDAHREAQASAADRRLQVVTEAAAKRRTAALAQLAAGARRQAEVIAENTWQLPVASGAYHLTSRFGDCSSLWSHCHTGLDFAAPDGTPIHAVAAGTVKEVGYAGAYGNQTIITTRDGVDLWYCHQSATAVQPGDRVSAGQVIGAVGSTGNTTGPHVHLEVRPRPDDPVDPFAVLVSHGVHP